MLQNPRKTISFKKNIVYKIPPGGEVNHIQPVAYTSGYLNQWCQNGKNHWINGIHISFDCEINAFLHNHISNRFWCACIHARESLY